MPKVDFEPFELLLRSFGHSGSRDQMRSTTDYATVLLRLGMMTNEPRLANLLGLTLVATGDLEGALAYAQRALQIDEKVYGSDPS